MITAYFILNAFIAGMYMYSVLFPDDGSDFELIDVVMIMLLLAFALPWLFIFTLKNISK